MSMTKRGVLMAKNVAVVIQPLNRDEATGALTAAGGTFTLTGRAGQVTVAKQRETERVDADDDTGADIDWTKKNWTVTIEGLKLTTGAAGDLEDLDEDYDILEVLIQWTRAGTPRPRYWVGMITEFNWDKVVGKNVDRLTLSRISTGQDNPSVASQI